MKKIFLIFLIMSIMLLGCQEQSKKVSEKECNQDTDCKVSGCNNEICAKEQMFSACIVKPEFECYKITSCKCIEGKCGWGQTKEFSDCIDKFK